MTKPLENRELPLALRVKVSDAALAYANALVGGSQDEVHHVHEELLSLTEDLNLCLRALELGAVFDA